jgi:hypothetical protein
MDGRRECGGGGGEGLNRVELISTTNEHEHNKIERKGRGEKERRRTTLCGDHTAVTESIAEELEVGLLEEGLGGALGVGAIGDDNVELVLAVLEELEAVADVDLDLGVLEADAHAGEVLLGDADDGLEVSMLISFQYGMCFNFQSFARTSSMSHRMASSTHSCLTTSRRTPPSPPPMTRTFLGSGWEFMARWVIISW